MKVILAKYPVSVYREALKQIPEVLVNDKALRDMELYNMYVDLRMIHREDTYIPQLSDIFNLSGIQVKRIIAAGRKYFKNKMIIKSNAA